MVKLEFTESTGTGYRHRTWTRIDDGSRRLSSLQNQFALMEFEISEAEAVQQFRVWLWQELKDTFNVVSTEMRQLATAHRQGREVEVLVPKDAPHGAVIVRAILWLADHLPDVEQPAIRSSEPGPCYEPIVEDGMISTRAEIDPKYIVWITGKTQSRIGVICGRNEAFVPEYGVVPLKNFRWVNRKLATSPGLQRLLNDELDKAFEAEVAKTPLEYDPAPTYSPEERFDDDEWFWQQTAEERVETEVALASAERDVMTLVEQLAEEVGDVEAALAVAQTPEVDDWFTKRPPIAGYLQPSRLKPVYLHKGEQSPLKVKSVEDQLEGRRWRYATRAEVQEYIRTFRRSPADGRQHHINLDESTWPKK